MKAVILDCSQPCLIHWWKLRHWQGWHQRCSRRQGSPGKREEFVDGAIEYQKVEITQRRRWTWNMKIWKRKAKRMSPAFRMMLTFKQRIRMRMTMSIGPPLIVILMKMTLPASSSWSERVSRIWPTKERRPMPIIINLDNWTSRETSPRSHVWWHKWWWLKWWLMSR